jgi:hypothetical protein
VIPAQLSRTLTAFFLYRDDVYNPDKPPTNVAEIILGKSRFSAAGTVIYQEFRNGHFLPIDQYMRKRENPHSTGGKSSETITLLWADVQQ